MPKKDGESLVKRRKVSMLHVIALGCSTRYDVEGHTYPKMHRFYLFISLDMIELDVIYSSIDKLFAKELHLRMPSSSIREEQLFV